MRKSIKILGFLLLVIMAIALLFLMTGCDELKSITVSPSSATISVGATQQYHATGHNTHGDEDITTQADWSVSGGGTIGLHTGLFTATTPGGPYTITAKATDRYGNTKTGTATVTVNKVNQTITFGPLPTKTYGDIDFALTATASSGLPVSYISSNPSVCTIILGNTVHITGAGTSNITASQPGNSTYNPAPNVTQTLTVNKADAVITVTGWSGTYDGSAHGVISSSATGVLVEDLSSLLHIDATTYTNATGGLVHWIFDGNTNYNATSGDATVTINKADAVIIVTGWSGTYDGSAHGVISSSATGVLVEDLSSLLHIDATTYTNATGGLVHWIFDGNTNYNATSGDATVTINKADAVIIVTGWSGTYDGSAHGVISSSATGVLVEDLSSLLHIDATTYTNATGGLVHWIFDGNTNYNATSGDATVTINKADAVITVTGWSGTYDGSAHGVISSSATGVLVEDLSSLLHIDATTYTNATGGLVHWIFDGNTNYNATSGDATVTINKADALITVTGWSGTYDGNPHGITYSAWGVESTPVDLSGLLSFSSPTSYTNVPGGSVTWSFAGNGNYNFTSGGPVDVTIGKADAVISVTGWSGTYDGNPHGITYSAWGVESTPVDLSGLLSFSGPTSYTNVPGGSVTWSFAGNGNYNFTSGGPVDVTIGKADAVITVTGWSGECDGNPHGASGTATGVGGANLIAYLNLGATFTDVPGGTAYWSFSFDPNYNDANGSVAIVIVDTTPPTITAPPDITVIANTIGGATGVALGSPTVSDIADPSPIVTNNAPLFFPLGTTTVTWTATDASGNSANATQTVTVNPGPLDHIIVTPPSATIAVHFGIQQYTAQGYDQYSNPISGLTYTWSVLGGISVGSIDSTGLFTAGNIAGSYTGVIMATSGVITGTASVTTLPGGVDHIVVSPSNPSVVVTGTQQYTAQAYDQYGNMLGAVITWSVSDPIAGSINAGSGLFTAGTVVGSYSNVIVATSGLVTGYASVTVVTSGAVGYIIVTPDNSSLNVNGTQQYTAQAYDPYDNPISMTFTWSVTDGTAGSIDINTGFFTAGTVAGSYTGVIMASAGGMSGTASVTVLAGAIASIVITPDPTSLPVGGTQQFTAQGFDQYGNPVDMTFTWTMNDPTAGSIDANGLFTAGTTAGTFDGLIQASSGGLSGAASVTLTTELNVGPEVPPTENQSISGPITDNGSNWWWWLIISVLSALVLLFLLLVIGRRKKKQQQS